MPYLSDKQRRFFNANRKQLEARGVDVDEWNATSRGKKLPEEAEQTQSSKSKTAVMSAAAAAGGYTVGNLIGGERGGQIGASTGLGAATGTYLPMLYAALNTKTRGKVLESGDPEGIVKQMLQNLKNKNSVSWQDTQGVAKVMPGLARAAAAHPALRKLTAAGAGLGAVVGGGTTAALSRSSDVPKDVMTSVKAALDIQEPGKAEKFIASTAGRVGGLLPAALVGQERAGDMLANSDPARHQQLIEMMKAKYPQELEGTALRFGGTNVLEDMRRVWQNENTTALGKVLGSVSAVPNAMVSSLNRSSNYDPLSDTATVYGNMPEITAHELGHAVDFNKAKTRPPGFLSRATRDLYALSSVPESRTALKVGPMTHFKEIAANRAVAGAAGDVADPEEAKKLTAELWRRLAPAYGTYVGATAAGVDKIREMVTGKPTVTSTVSNALARKLLGSGSPRQRLIAGAIQVGLLPAAGAITGRGIAELRNAIASRRATTE